MFNFKKKSPIYIISIILFLSINFIVAQSLDKSELEFHKVQDSILSYEIESLFDFKTPAYQSQERKNALFLIDAITHSPFPHNNSLKNLFLNRYKKTIKSIKSAKVNDGILLWNIYNIAYIVKTPKVTVAFDLTRLPSSLRLDGKENTYNELAKELVQMCDILFISHKHGDHADSYIVKEFLLQNKPVITNFEAFKEESFYNQITHLPRNGEDTFVKIPIKDSELKVRIYPGHQAISDTTSVANNFTLITFPSNITIAHSGDQSWATDFTWLDNIHKDIAIDILLVNTWTLWPDRLIKGLKPKIILPSHINEMDHEINGRIPYWKSYQNWKNGGDKVIHLFWGEQYSYSKKQ